MEIEIGRSVESFSHSERDSRFHIHHFLFVSRLKLRPQTHADALTLRSRLLKREHGRKQAARGRMPRLPSCAGGETEREERSPYLLRDLVNVEELEML